LDALAAVGPTATSGKPAATPPNSILEIASHMRWRNPKKSRAVAGQVESGSCDHWRQRSGLRLGRVDCEPSVDASSQSYFSEFFERGR
jgi:hypothetical protein